MSKRASSWQRAGLVALVVLALLLPFELEAPWLSLGPLQVTNVELVLGVALLLAVVSWWQDGRFALPLPRAWVVLGLWFIAALLLSSLLAPQLRGNAVRAALRTLTGLALVPAVLPLVRTRREALWLAGGVVAGGVLAAVLGTAEVVRGAPFAWLTLFRERPTLAGPFLRLAGPFDYANQAAMYIEATLPLLVAFTVSAYRRRRRAWTVVLLLAFFLYVQAAFLTFSRSSFGTLLLVNVALFLYLWLTAPQQRARRRVWGGVAAAVALLIAGYVVVNPTFRLRLTSESDSAWYRAQIDAPRELTLAADETRPVAVTLYNSGALTWRSDGINPFRLAARWYQPQTDKELAFQPRWSLQRPLPPGESMTLEVPVRAPVIGGEYELVWDMLHENVTWFDAKTDTAQRSHVTVTGDAPQRDNSAGQVSMESVDALRLEPPLPGRLSLWTAAWEQFGRFPLLGIGLDNFRLTYGSLLGLETWNETVHTNNWYVETLVSLGVIGALPFFFWLALLLLDVARTLPQRATTIWQTAVAAGLLAFLVHGLLDYFLLFNATALLFWLLVGLWLRLKTLPATV